MLNAIGEIKTSVEIEFFEELDPVNRLLNARTVAELKEQVNQIFNEINEYYERKNGGLLSDKADVIVEYVKEHCLDPNISITELSDKFQISRSYISRIFKKRTGMGMVDYIHELRLDRAKELMKDTDLSLKEIAEKVGFCHSVTMSRAFRKIEGVTPGQFRNIE
jgi:AraC-like DNA-binding protein